jgi:hypothetical protein
VDALLDAIHELSALDASAADERLHRLHLTLISVVPSLPLKLLPRVLEEIRTILTTRGGAQSGSGDKVKVLVDATFVEISERVGDREKELVMRWWYDNRISFLYGTADEAQPIAQNELPQSRL